MALGDEQIERYSRQIILPEIGGRGQERLLAAAIAVIGAGPLAATAARYLAGAGIGALRLAGADSDHLGRELRALNPDVTVSIDRAEDRESLVVAADLTVEAFDACAGRARALGVPLVAAAARASAGWIHIDRGGGGCAGCAARAARWERTGTSMAALAPIAVGVLGSLLALAAIEVALGAPNPPPPLRWFDASAATLTPQALTPVAGCGGCAPPRPPA